MSRDERVNAVLIRALAGVRLAGRARIAGGSAALEDALRGAGLSVDRWRRYGRDATLLPDTTPVDRVALRLPKGRRNLEACLHVLAAGMASGGRLWLHGANDEGIKSAGSALRRLFQEVRTVDSRFHGRLWEATALRVEPEGLDAMERHFEAEVAGKTLSLCTLPGVFADGRVDEGTRLLLAHLRVDAGARVLDFGCGAGVIGAWLADRTDRITGYDVDAWAVACARKNAPGEVHLCDGWSDVEGRYEHIVSNPPFHRGKDTDFRVMGDLIAGAGDRLERRGRLTLVCPATAPIRDALARRFRRVRRLGGDRRYVVWEAEG